MKRCGLAIVLTLLAGTACLAQAPFACGPAGCPTPCCPAACCPRPDATAGAGWDPNVWFTADYLLWWVRKGGSPPLVSTGSAGDAFPGAIDQPGTQVLFGGDGLNYGRLNGLRVGFGAWLGDTPFGVEVGGFVLERRSVGFAAQGDANGQPFLAVPFVNANTGRDNVYFASQNFADPARSAGLTGGVRASSGTHLWAWEVNGVANGLREGPWAADLLAGFRQVSLRENLSLGTAATNLVPGGAASFLGTPLDPGFFVATRDRFLTENLFNGPQVGARVEARWGRFTAGALAKVALGVVRERVIIQGQTVTDAPLPVQQSAGGIFAQPTNATADSRDFFAVVPEGAVNLGVELTANARVRVGYTFLYLSRVARPGDQVDPALNPNRVPIDNGFGTPGGPDRPTLDFKSTGFWAQGVNIGVELGF